MTSREQKEELAWAKSEAYFFNHGANIAAIAFLISFDIGMATWGAWEFTEPNRTIDNDVLRITLPIARAGGRLVTWNTALLLLSACKYMWTWLRGTPIALGFPINNVMPYYHRMFAQTIIVMGCVVHSVPQIVNYATENLKIEFSDFWSQNTLATGQLFVTGLALLFIFAAFFVTHLEHVRRTIIGFRVFWWTHVIGIIFVFPLLIIHGTILGVPILLYFVALPLALYVTDSFLRRVKVARFNAEVVHLRAHTDGKHERVVQIVVSNPKFVYQPGQYAEINIPQISRSEWHPFTIASAPNPGKPGDVEFFVKACGKWTNEFFELVLRIPNNMLANGTKGISQVGIRGPFGAPAQNYFDYQHIVCIGSGIGVTPLLSIWKYLVEKSREGDSEAARPCFGPNEKASRSKLPKHLEEKRLLDSENVDHIDVVAFEGKELSSGRAQAAFYASVFESMTVNICLLVFSLGMETLIFCMWLYKLTKYAAMLQIAISAVAIVVFGGKIGLSLYAYGGRYFRSFVFRLEGGVFLLDLVSYITSILTVISPSRKTAVLYFTFFGGFMALHAVRIFHIFYASARPPSDAQLMEKRKAGGKSTIKSVVGVWVSKKYSSMSFAAPDLVRTVRNLSSAFSLQLFATRDEESDVKEADPFCESGPNHALHSGRPDWEEILSDAIDRAHCTRECGGEVVGVFFCGSPAIASTLQRTAQEVTANHQYSTGGSCQCRLLVHKENF